MREKCVFPSWFWVVAGSRCEINCKSPSQTGPKTARWPAGNHRSLGKSNEWLWDVSASTRQVVVKMWTERCKPETATVHLQSKNCTFWNVLLAAVRCNVYLKGERSLPLVSIELFQLQVREQKCVFVDLSFVTKLLLGMAGFLRPEIFWTVLLLLDRAKSNLQTSWL